MKADTALWAALGLGNPLPEYAPTRHNVGHRVIEEMARRTNSRLRRRGNLQMAGSNLQGSQLILAKSLTYMNESGLAAEEIVRRTGIPPSRLLVICDDIDLPLLQAVCRFRTGRHDLPLGLDEIDPVRHDEVADYRQGCDYPDIHPIPIGRRAA